MEVGSDQQAAPEGLSDVPKLLEGPPSIASLEPTHLEAQAQGVEPLEDKANASILCTLLEVGEREQAVDVRRGEDGQAIQGKARSCRVAKVRSPCLPLQAS